MSLGCTSTLSNDCAKVCQPPGSHITYEHSPNLNNFASQTMFDQYNQACRLKWYFFIASPSPNLADKRNKNALRKQFPLFDASGQSTITRVRDCVNLGFYVLSDARATREEDEEKNSRRSTWAFDWTYCCFGIFLWASWKVREISARMTSACFFHRREIFLRSLLSRLIPMNKSLVAPLSTQPDWNLNFCLMQARDRILSPIIFSLFK